MTPYLWSALCLPCSMLREARILLRFNSPTRLFLVLADRAFLVEPWPRNTAVSTSPGLSCPLSLSLLCILHTQYSYCLFHVTCFYSVQMLPLSYKFTARPASDPSCPISAQKLCPLPGLPARDISHALVSPSFLFSYFPFILFFCFF